MNPKTLIIKTIIGIICCSIFIGITNAQNKEQPILKQTSFTGESVTLQNEQITFNFYQRYMGWGWGEVKTPDGNIFCPLPLSRLSPHEGN